MFSCILIDDEQHAVEALKDYLNHVPDIEIVGTYLDPIEALNAIKNTTLVDLVLLDVNMPTLSGVELASLIRNKTKKLVFTTGHAKYAYDAFEVQADAYLLKPYTLTKFLDTIAKLGMHDNSREELDFFFVKSRGDNLKMIKVFYKDIISVESLLNYITIHTLTKKIVTYMSLTMMQEALSKYGGFMKIQRSYIVQTAHISAIDGNTLEMIDGQKITIGEPHRAAFNSFLAKNNIKGEKKIKDE